MANYTADPMDVSFTAHTSEHSNEAVQALAASFTVVECSDGGSTVTYNYRKRAWRTESSAYVEWTTMDPAGAYPGGGTLDPPLGTILYRWTT